jgi:ApbE superfamily uncharacterized protein (UPF0280 family)
MKRRLRIAWLPDGKRLQLSDPPIELIVQAFGRPGDIARAYDAAIDRMRHVLDELNSELAVLRLPAPQTLQNALARRMNNAAAPFCAENFITPLAAFAGAVADDVLAAMQNTAPLDRAFVNSGGDIALYLAEGQSFTSSMLERPGRPSLSGTLLVEAGSGIGGIATAGRSGPGLLLGIADSVVVAAGSAAAADVAATMIANATDLPGHKAIARAPARSLRPDSDLGDRLVTTGVAALTPQEVATALAAGAGAAEVYLAAGLIKGAALYLRGETAFVGGGGVEWEV